MYNDKENNSDSSKLIHEGLGILLLSTGILGIMSFTGSHFGIFSIYIEKCLKYSFGIGAIVIPLVIAVRGLSYIWEIQRLSVRKWWRNATIYISFLVIYHYLRIPEGREILPESLLQGGGLIGGFICFFARRYDSVILVSIVLICGVVFIVRRRKPQ